MRTFHDLLRWAVGLALVILSAVLLWMRPWAGPESAVAPLGPADPALRPAPVAAEHSQPYLLAVQQASVAAALVCVRPEDAPPLIVSAELSQRAAELAQAVSADPQANLADLLAAYDWAAVVPLALESAAGACQSAGFDPQQLNVPALQAVGVAVLPSVGYAPATAILIGKERP